MLISSFQQPSTGEQDPKQRHFRLAFRQRGQGSLRQAVMHGQYPFSEQKQWEAKVKIKEQV